ncbi:MAG: hypothetical protein GX815_00625 [Clostridiales bacterium]|nr:hypothetical protein [Clostridiales bacterium]
MLKSRSLIIVLVIVFVLTLSTTAFATYNGWWNNAVKILQNSTHYSSFYNMGTKIVGTLGHWAHAESGTEVLRITPQYYYNNTLYSSHPKDANIYKNATFVEKHGPLMVHFKQDLDSRILALVAMLFSQQM